MAKIPKLVKLDPGQLQEQAVRFDTEGYNLADADYLKRFPALVAGRDFSVQTAADTLAGVQDPIYNRALEASGLGPVDLGKTSFERSRNLGQDILASEKRDRNYFETLFKENPGRTFGLSPGDITNVALANSGAQTQFNAATVGSKINQLNADAAQNAALAGVLGQLGGKVASTATSALIPRTTTNYLDPATYNPPSNYYNPSGTIDPNVYVAPVGSDVAGAFTMPENPNGGGF